MQGSPAGSQPPHPPCPKEDLEPLSKSLANRSCVPTVASGKAERAILFDIPAFAAPWKEAHLRQMKIYAQPSKTPSRRPAIPKHRNNRRRAAIICLHPSHIGEGLVRVDVSWFVLCAREWTNNVKMKFISFTVRHSLTTRFQNVITLHCQSKAGRSLKKLRHFLPE